MAFYNTSPGFVPTLTRSPVEPFVKARNVGNILPVPSYNSDGTGLYKTRIHQVLMLNESCIVVLFQAPFKAYRQARVDTGQQD